MTYDMSKMDTIHEKLVSISADLKRLLQAQPDHIKMETKPIAVESLETKSRVQDSLTDRPVTDEYKMDQPMVVDCLRATIKYNAR